MSTLFRSENYDEYRQYLLRFGEDNSQSVSRLKRNLLRATREELTPRQWQMVKLYYVDQLKMPDIARLLGVTPSTVSRNIQRGRRRLQKCLRYGARELLTEEAS